MKVKTPLTIQSPLFVKLKYSIMRLFSVFIGFQSVGSYLGLVLEGPVRTFHPSVNYHHLQLDQPVHHPQLDEPIHLHHSTRPRHPSIYLYDHVYCVLLLGHTVYYKIILPQSIIFYANEDMLLFFELRQIVYNKIHTIIYYNFVIVVDLLYIVQLGSAILYLLHQYFSRIQSYSMQ